MPTFCIRFFSLSQFFFCLMLNRRRSLVRALSALFTETEVNFGKTNNSRNYYNNLVNFHILCIQNNPKADWDAALCFPRVLINKCAHKWHFTWLSSSKIKITKIYNIHSVKKTFKFSSCFATQARSYVYSAHRHCDIARNATWMAQTQKVANNYRISRNGLANDTEHRIPLNREQTITTKIRWN